MVHDPSAPTAAPHAEGDQRNVAARFWRRGAVLCLLGLVAAALLSAGLLSISHSPRPHHLAVGWVGSTQGAAALERSAGEALRVEQLPNEQAAITRIRTLKLYGAFVVDGGGTQLLIANAASPQVATVLKTMATRLTTSPNTVEVTDVVPLPAGDPGGNGLATMIQVTVLAGTIGALGLGRLVPRYRANPMAGELPIALQMVYAMVVSSGVVAIASAFGVGSQAGWWPRLLALALVSLSVTASVCTFVAIAGTAGAAVGGVVFFLLGVPTSGGATALPMMPPAWRDFGQALPTGAGATLLRRVFYFPGAAIRGPVAVLVLYAAIGIVAIVTLSIAALRHRALTGPA